MLDWLSASAGAEPADNNNHELKDNSSSMADDPPETPAHIFAVRAFKTALFGTPAPPPTVRAPRESTQPPTASEAGSERTDESDEKLAEVVEQIRIESARRRDPFSSPSKGILMTPRTATARRKNVSFGGLKRTLQPKKPEADDCLVLPLDNDTQPVKALEAEKEDLRRNLFQSRTTRKTQLPQTIPSKTQDPNKDNESTAKNTSSDQDITADVTVDLKSPRSRSGKHWKQEYQKDHDKSMQEMRKLIRYGQAAKSYANKRDNEAIRLGEKLKQTEDFVKGMEDRVTDLSSQLAGTQLQDDNQARILDDLATQTAQALRYKQKAERYRIALRETKPSASLPDDTLQMMSQGSHAKQASNEQMQDYQMVAESAQRKVAELEKKNEALKQNLLQTKAELKSKEERHQKSIERRKKREDQLTAERNALKEQLKESRSLKTGRTNELATAPTRPRDAEKRMPSSKQTSDLRIHKEADVEGPLGQRQEQYAHGTGRSSTLNGTQSRKNATISRTGPLQRIEKFGEGRLDGALDLKETTASARNIVLPGQSTGVPRGGETALEDSKVWMNIDSSSDSEPVSRPCVPRALAPLAQSTQRIQRTSVEATPSPPHRSRQDLAMSSSFTHGTVRKQLPPDRAAAAKRRIQQRMADKKRTRDVGKENL